MINNVDPNDIINIKLYDLCRKDWEKVKTHDMIKKL